MLTATYLIKIYVDFTTFSLTFHAFENITNDEGFHKQSDDVIPNKQCLTGERIWSNTKKGFDQCPTSPSLFSSIV